MKQAMINYIKNEKFDNIYTPEYAIKPLLKYIPNNITVWECCDFGGSKITKVLKEYGCNVISTDKEENFLTYEPETHFDMIITNLPYSLKDEFLKRCYEWNKPFALLLPITALEGIKRGKMFRENGIELMVFDKRINFMENMFDDYKSKSGNWFNTSWFCHDVLSERLIFEELRRE